MSRRLRSSRSVEAHTDVSDPSSIDPDAIKSKLCTREQSIKPTTSATMNHFKLRDALLLWLLTSSICSSPCYGHRGVRGLSQRHSTTKRFFNGIKMKDRRLKPKSSKSSKSSKGDDDDDDGVCPYGVENYDSM